jgi:pantoate--beta-alanine ligase
MDIIRTRDALRARLRNESSIGLVPTMGNLHAGHIALVEDLRTRSSCVVSSIFVNRLQFGAGEDFDRYPRTLDEDAQKLNAAGCDILFAPDESELYPDLPLYRVTPPELSLELEGEVRPGHFVGVCTVVLKLFQLVRPHRAIFGKKDYQQWVLLKGMVESLFLPIEMIPGETVRAPDGLALSSRNGYLSPDERARAPMLYQALRAIEAKCLKDRDVDTALREATLTLHEAGWQVDYLTLREADTLKPLTDHSARCVVLGAARLGRTRLLDNLEFTR